MDTLILATCTSSASWTVHPSTWVEPGKTSKTGNSKMDPSICFSGSFPSRGSKAFHASAYSHSIKWWIVPLMCPFFKLPLKALIDFHCKKKQRIERTATRSKFQLKNRRSHWGNERSLKYLFFNSFVTLLENLCQFKLHQHRSVASA